MLEGMGLCASFLAGLLSGFSPCILPLIPITLGIVGAVSASTRLRGFLVSLIFVLGISFVYTFLGVVSALLGILWGTLFVNPITYLILALIFFLLSASSLGLIKLNIPVSFGYTGRARGSLVSVFILGMISAFASIPCNFPFLGGILSLISLKRSVVYGASALFLFSFGQGGILIVAGTFTSLIRKLPKQSLGFIVIQKCFGLFLAAAGVYFGLKFIYSLG